MEEEEDLSRCILSIHRTKQLFKFLGFGFLFLWILFGHYGGRQGERVGQVSMSSASFTGRRRLLADQCSNASYDDCECSDIHQFVEELQCEFVQNVESCGGDDGFISYFEFVYCLLPIKFLPLSLIILAFWLLYLFTLLGTTAEEYFCKALTVITKILRLSQNVAGVTLLAIGNGAPDIFSVLAAFTHPDEKRTSLAFGALFGAGMFVTTVVVGGVVLLRPFMLTRRPFLRDNIFYLFAVYWGLFVLWENEITIAEAIGFLFYYLLYVAVVVFGALIYQKWAARKLNFLKLGQHIYSEPERSGTVSSGAIRYSDTAGISDLSEERVRVMDTDIDEEEDNTRLTEDEKLMSVTIRPTESGALQSSTPQSTPQSTPRSTTCHHILRRSDKMDNSKSSTNEENSGLVEELERPRTPAERSASRASQKIYGTDNEGEEEEEKDIEHDFSIRPITPRSRPSSRIEQVIDEVAYVAEDLIVGSNPNLAKVWGPAYRKEMENERNRANSRTYITADEDSHYESFSSSPNPTDIKTVTVIPTTHEQQEEARPLLKRQTRNPEPSFCQKQFAAFLKLLTALFPVRRKFIQAGIVSKIFFIIKLPIYFFLTLTIPVVDFTEPMNNWNKWLNVLHCFTSPVFASLATEVGLMTLGSSKVPAVVLFGFVGLVLAVVVALTSHNHKPPIYHCIFAWAGFLLSVMWIYAIANEIVNLLQVFGIVVKLSDGILGVTLLAWGNSIQDSVTNLTMARRGFPRMAIGACFGGPLLNLLIGVGLASVVKIIKERTLTFGLYFTQVEMVAAFFLLLSLSCSLIFMSCLRFRMYRFYSLFLFLFYLVFLVVVILAEAQVFNIELAELSPL